MSLILNIDTSLENASVCIAEDDRIIEVAVNENQKDHAAWLHPAINELLQNNNYCIQDLDAIAVTIGPGSYTGLRVGLSAAKGFCFALNIPLITVGTLYMLAFAVKNEAAGYIVPAIDARRMEIYTALYDKTLKEITSPHTMIADENSFFEILKSQNILFCGNANEKLKKIIKNDNAFFTDSVGNAAIVARIACDQYQQKKFADIVYIEPVYLKEFYSPSFRK